MGRHILIATIVISSFLVGCDNFKATDVVTEDFNSLEMAMFPNPKGMINFVKRDDAPVVEMNALVFNEFASGEE